VLYQFAPYALEILSENFLQFSSDDWYDPQMMLGDEAYASNQSIKQHPT
jgi:hypothetical protein